MATMSYAEALKCGLIKAKDIPASARKSVSALRDIEGQEQAQVIEWIRLKYPKEGPLLIHIPNGGSRSNKYEGWRMKAQGARAGVSDLFLAVARGEYHGFWLEFKAAPPNSANISKEQRDWIRLMREEGYAACICKGPEAAMRAIELYLSGQFSEEYCNDEVFGWPR